MGYVKVLLLLNGERFQFVESFGSFLKEIDKNEQIENFFWFIINLLSAASCWQRCREVQ